MMTDTVLQETSSGVQINPEFKALIPPLSAKNKELLDRCELGFTSRQKCGSIVNLYPTSMSPSYWIWVRINAVEMIEEYSPRPVAVSRLPWGMIGAKSLTPIKSSKYDAWPPSEKAHTKKQCDTNLYLIQSGMGGPFKIGISQNISARLQQLQCGSPFPLHVIHQVNGIDAKLERQLHNKLSQYRLHGEWFDEQALPIVKEIIKEEVRND